MLRIMLVIGGVVVLAVAIVGAWYVYQDLPGPAPEEIAEPAAKAQPAEDLKLPDAVGDTAAAAVGQQVLVSEEKKKEAKRARVTGYIHDEKLPAGTLHGVCYVPCDKEVRLYPTWPLELKGDNAIPNPLPGEVDYFENRPPRKPVWLAQHYREKKRCGVKAAIVAIQNVPAGRLRHLDRISYFVDFRSHYLVAQKPEGENVHNPSWFNIGFAPPGQLIQFRNLTLFDTDLVVKRTETGEVIQELALKGYRDERRPNTHFGTVPNMKEPLPVELPRIRESGLYTITCKQHPWQKAHLYVADSPYVTLTDTTNRGGGQARGGEFLISGVPPGKYTVEVWHPDLQPVKKTHEVEILPDQETELSVEFAVPPVLTAPPPKLPEKPITEWAFVGPFDPLDEAADAEVKKLQFGVQYNGKYDRVSWEKVTLPVVKDGHDSGWFRMKGRWEPRVEGTCFLATRLDSPSAQELCLRLAGSCLTVQVLLNGKPLYYTSDVRELEYEIPREEGVLITGDLKQGQNILLVRMTGPSGEEHQRTGIHVDYLAEGVEPKTPDFTAAGALADTSKKGSLVLTDETYWRCQVTRGPLRLNPRLLKDEKWLAGRRDLARCMRRVENDTKDLHKDKDIDWTKTDWRDKAVYFAPITFYYSMPMMSLLPQNPPAAEWMRPEFDDSDWMTFWNTKNTQAQFDGGIRVWNWYLRTDFNVPDNAQPSDLKLDLAYHGGARVFVNGTEVARGHLPQGELGPDVAAEEYTEDAYYARADEQAKSPVPRAVGDLKVAFFDAPKDERRAKELEKFRSPNGSQFVYISRECWDRLRKLRDRELGAVTIPAKLLRKGRNVLAVEIRGSYYFPDVYDTGWGSKDYHMHWDHRSGLGWAHAELLRLELRDPTGAVPSATEPKKGLQVWAEDMHCRVVDLHARPVSTPVGTVRMVGALNGTYSGIAVVRSDSEITDLKVTMSDLKAPGDKGTIATGNAKTTGMVGRPLQDFRDLDFGARDANVSAGYLRAAAMQAAQSPVVPKRQKNEDFATWFNNVLSKVNVYDHIGPTLPQRVPAGTAQPLWISLRVPMETQPGTYKGNLAIAAGGEKLSVPVEIEVIGWRVPSPAEFKTDTWLEQHPYAIANHYLLPKGAEIRPGTSQWEGPVKAKVPLWTDEHFKLLEPSFQQLARAGNDVLHVPVIIRTEFGNWQDTMIKWIRKKDGAFAFDYRVLDRYLDLATKYLGRPRVVDFVVMQCVYAAGSSAVTVFDEATGKTEELNVGHTAPTAVRLAAWKAFATSLLAHMKERGQETSVYWGHGGDFEHDPALMAYLYEVFPGTYWSASGHTYHGGAGGGGHSRNVVRCFSDIYGCPKPLYSAMGWKGPAVSEQGYPFGGVADSKYAEHFKTYRADETYLYIHNPRDYAPGAGLPIRWRSLPAMALREGYSGVGRCGLDGYNHDWLSGLRGMDWGFPGRPCNMLTWPGEKGAEPSARFEALLEGIQETEARIFLEQAVDGGDLPDDVAEDAKLVLDDHIRHAMMPLVFRDGAAEEYLYPWQAESRKLYAMAAEVAEIVGVDINHPDVALKVPALGRAPRSFKIRNWTGKPREWRAAASAPWIVPARTQGRLLGFEDFDFVIDGKDLKPGEIQKGHILITDVANGRQSKFDITATVEPPIMVTYEHPNFNMWSGQSETREFRIQNRAVTEQDWQLVAPVPWIKIEPSSGRLKAGEERHIRLTANPPDKQAVLQNQFVVKGAGGLVETKFLSKTFVIPMLKEKEDRAMPPGKIIKIEDMSKRFKSGVFCKNGTIIEWGVGVREWGAPHTKKIENDRQMYRSPTFAADSSGPTNTFVLLIGKEKFTRGLWVYPHFEAVYNVEGMGITGFSAYVGITRDACDRQIRHHQYRANFEIWVDGQVRAQSGLMRPTDEARYLTVEGIKDAKEFKLVTRLDCDQDDPTYLCTWADLQFYAEK
jgi:hypothetical protein